MAESRDITGEHARTAAELQPDVAVEHVGALYGKALLGAAENAGQTEAVLAEFDALLSDVLDRHPKLEEILGSALISHEERQAVLDRLFAGRMAPVLLNFLKVVSRHGRLDCLRAMHRQTHVLFDKLRGRIRVELITAAPVDDATAARIAAQLRAALGGEPLLSRRVDPGLIGGAVLKVGDTVHDASIANQLDVLRQQMNDRSAHEIQSRRDRFRNPAGN